MGVCISLSQHQQEAPKHLKHIFCVSSFLVPASGLLVTASGANQLVTGQSERLLNKMES